MIYFFSDSHFRHNNIIGYCGRPTNCEQQMWDNLNKMVGSEDTLIHCGDVGWYSSNVIAREDIAKLPGKMKILVKGNHDKSHTLKGGWTKIFQDKYEFEHNGLKFIVQHSPFLFNHFEAPRLQRILPPVLFDILRRRFGKNFNLPKVDIAIHGHIHEKGVQYRWHEGTLIVNACVEHWLYRPFSIDEVVDEYHRRKLYRGRVKS